jgi:hypothetical protein
MLGLCAFPTLFWKTTPGRHAALFTAAAAKLHQIHVANLRNPLFVILKTQYAKPLKYNYVDGWSIARPIWQSQVNYIDNIKKYLTG